MYLKLKTAELLCPLVYLVDFTALLRLYSAYMRNPRYSAFSRYWYKSTNTHAEGGVMCGVYLQLKKRIQDDYEVHKLSLANGGKKAKKRKTGSRPGTKGSAK